MLAVKNSSIIFLRIILVKEQQILNVILGCDKIMDSGK